MYVSFLQIRALLFWEENSACTHVSIVYKTWSVRTLAYTDCMSR